MTQTQTDENFDQAEALEMLKAGGFMTTGQVASIFGVDRSTVIRAIANRKVPAVPFGDTSRIPRLWVDRQIERLLADYLEIEGPHLPFETAEARDHVVGAA